jgi:HSP20 family molecular chaperone IbpA
MYLDEVGLLKKLPRNERAEGLSESCGFKGVHFYGDMYVGAIRAEPSPMRNVDFAVNDLDSSSDWLRRAASENVLHDQSMDQLRDAMRGKGGAPSGGDGDGGMPGGEGGNYRWSQTDDSIELIVDVPLGTRAKDVSVAFKPSSFSVSVRGADAAAIAVPKTYRATRPDESTWTMDDGKVVVTIAKMDEQVWYGLEGLP